MAQQEDRLDKDFIDRLKDQDSRWRLVEEAIKVEQELRDSHVLKIILKQMNEDADVALRKLADVNPTDVKAITALQAVVQRAKIAASVIEEICRTGAFTLQSLHEEGPIETGELQEGR